jgi:hypothetical protein
MFAGEATNPTQYSTTHGAYATGIREADRLSQLYKKWLILAPFLYVPAYQLEKPAKFKIWIYVSCLLITTMSCAIILINTIPLIDFEICRCCDWEVRL